MGGGVTWTVQQFIFIINISKKCDATKIQLCEIMGLVSISRKYKMRKTPCQKSAG